MASQSKEGTAKWLTKPTDPQDLAEWQAGYDLVLEEEWPMKYWQREGYSVIFLQGYDEGLKDYHEAVTLDDEDIYNRHHRS